MLEKLLLGLLFLAPQLHISQDLNSELSDVYQNFSLMGMSIWVSANGEETVYHFGKRDFERDLDINDNTQFRIASISKAFTAIGLIKLYHEGLFDLDDDISTVLGYTVRNPQHPSTPITYRMLLSHQSGLQDGTGYGSFVTATFDDNNLPNISELITPSGTYYTSNMWRTETPGTYFAYSNINFGLIGALIEKHSDERFDVFMKSEILEPLEISGSYNIQDLPNINDLAVLYRNQGGWTPQVDNYQGVLPTPPDLSSYVPGTNGIYFAPQGGLRISAEETGKFLDFLNSNGANSELNISAEILAEMKAIAWDYNGSNGDNYFGLFNRWGLGLHHANISAGDQICNLGTYDTFLGHAGEAYGLISDAFYSETENIGFSLLINGSFNGYTSGTQSSFYTVEEAVYSALCSYFENQLSREDVTVLSVQIAPNPSLDSFEIALAQSAENIVLQLQDIKGSVLISEEYQNTNKIQVDVTQLNSGIYFLYLSEDNKSSHTKIIIE